MEKIITFGEILLRLTPNATNRFLQSKSFNADYGGAEANVSMLLSQFGHNTYHISSVPDNPIGLSAIKTLKKFGVNTSLIKKDRKRLGVYYHEQGSSLRPSKVIYDRADTSFSNISIEGFDFDLIFKDANWFHFSGISPALGKKPENFLKEILKYTRKYNVPVSCDLNFRSNLWSPEEAQKTLINIFPYVDICIDTYLGNDEDMPFYNKHNYINTNMTENQYELHLYEELFKKFIEKHNFKFIASTIRNSVSASDNILSACGYDGVDFYHTDKKPIRIVDRIGGGDSFAAGLIHSIIEGYSYKKSLDFALATSAIKHTIHGDIDIASINEVDSISSNNFSDMVYL